ncbi:MAG TPA: GTPase [Burkholderiales bacterium]|nr:GTPase [Burkholderiales bacterium]
MPANLSPEYKQAEQAFRRAREPRERLESLKEMLRSIPKHKGTEHLQADIKSRIKELTDELSGPRKTGHKGPSHTMRPEGAAQICLIGPPNAGKSSLHARLTGSHTEIGPYPYTTKLPVPGMLPFEDIHFQLVDLPPISADFMEPWWASAVQQADAALLVIDLADPDCAEQLLLILDRLAEKKITLIECWPGPLREPGAAPSTGYADPEGSVADPFHLYLPTLLIGNKADLANPEDALVLEELCHVRFPALATSTVTGQGMGEIGRFLFDGLNIVRVYTKAPGKPPERERPFTVRRGDTVVDVARLVHHDIARSLKFARVWGSGQFDGQHVGPDHAVADSDVVELHA